MLNFSCPELALLLCACLGSCLTPPAVMPGVHIDAELAIGLYPEGTEQVELPIGDGEVLRGLFVPAGKNAPVVLHLFEASGSVASLKYHYESLVVQLQGLGLASLLVDYSGVGASDGERSPRHLKEDAQAMWREALARTRGDSSRIMITIRFPWDTTTIISDPGQITDPLLARSIAEEEVARVAVRTLLKGARIPERVRTLPDGRIVLEVMQGEAWRELSLDPEKTPNSYGGRIPHELGDHAVELKRAQIWP